jgi:Big-like domain-containing protein
LAVVNAFGNTVSILLNTGGSNVKLVSSPNPSTQGQPVRFVVSVAAGLTGQRIPTGTVTLKDGSTVLAVLNLSHGGAQYITSSLGVGAHTITAFYSGNSNYNPNQSLPITQK